MSIQEKREEAEAVLDSAEMVLETVPEPRTGKAKKLETKLSELESEIQDPEDEKALNDLITEVRELMDQVQEDAMQDDPMMGPDDEMGGIGPGGAPPGGPDAGGPDEPPF